MKNHQAPTGRAISDGQTLEVHSIFPTIQGEGPFAGVPATFVRLAHCNLQCPACDTEYTDGAKPMSVFEIADRVYAETPRLVVITGGEPLRQNISALCLDLAYLRLKVQIETNGMLPLQGFSKIDRLLLNEVQLVVSPKTHRLDVVVAANASAFKYVVSADPSMIAEDGLPVRALDHPVPAGKTIARPPIGYDGPIFVQPADHYDDEANAANIAQAVRSVQMEPRQRRLCLQLHKYARLP